MKGTAWACEPEITAMAYLLNTTLAVFSRTAKKKSQPLGVLQAWTGSSLSDPMALLVNLHRFHSETVQYYNLP